MAHGLTVDAQVQLVCRTAMAGRRAVPAESASPVGRFARSLGKIPGCSLVTGRCRARFNWGREGMAMAHVLQTAPGERCDMLYTIAVILLILWLLGFVSGYTIGAFIHVLLVIALVLLLVGLLSGRRLA